jgi:copper transport protein
VSKLNDVRRCRRRSRILLLLGVVVAFALAVAAPSASAHAQLVRTLPGQASEQAKAPATVTFVFDEAVRSSRPAAFSGGTLKATASLPARLTQDGRALVVTLPHGLGRGVYSVTWHVLSDDGHEELGTLTFGVGVKPGSIPAAVGEQTETNVPLTFARWLFLLGVLAAAGLAGLGLALRPVLDEPGFAAAPARVARLSIAAFVLAATGAGLELVSLPLALGTRFGDVTAVAGVLSLVGALAATFGVGSVRAARLATAIAFAVVLAPPLAGHVLSPGRLRVVAVPVDVLHTLAAAAWLGGILWLLVLASTAVAAGAVTASFGVAGRRFSRIALGIVAALGVTGLVRAFVEFERVSQVWSTGYGRLLLVKTAVFVVLIALGARNRERLAPRPEPVRDGSEVVRIRRSLAAEAVLIAVIAAVVALLGSTTPPRSLAGTAAMGAAAPGTTTVFGRQADELALGIAVRRTGGSIAVDTTVLGNSGTPDDRVRVTVGPDLAANSPKPAPGVKTSVTPSSSTSACGPGRYCVTLPAAMSSSALRIAVRRASGRVSVATVRLPADPQPARAAALVATAARTLRAQHSLVIRERLAGDAHSAALRTTFREQAPDRLAYASRGAGEAIIVGNRRWDRSGPHARWAETPQDRLRVPALDWGSVRDAALLGTGVVAGRPVSVVSFSDPSVPAWFTVSIDRRTGLPLRVQMTAAAHFMDRRYGSFGVPQHIVAPPAP